MVKPESGLHKLLRQQSLAFLIVALLASVLLVALGYMVEPKNVMLSKILLTIGSSGLGTCFGLAIGTITGSSAVTRIKELIEQSLDSSVHAADEDLDSFRKVWHHYLLTRIDNKPVWRYRVVDFSKPSSIGKLLTAISVKGPNGDSHTYIVEGYVIKPRLVFIQRAAQGTELPIIHVYPFATESFRTVIAGTVYLQAWDGQSFGARALMSASKLPLELDASEYVEGTLPEKAYQKLNDLWKTESKVIGLLEA